MINAKIVADSKNKHGNRITTMVVTFPRFILAELNTHRMFSRNSASSRAIPFEKMLESVQNNPFIPIAWQKDHKGMQGNEYFTDEEVKKCGIIEQWLGARDFAVTRAKALSELKVTKQLCNRLLEPFMWHTVIITATEWENFFALRCPRYHSPVDTHFRHKSKKDCIAAHSNPVNLELMNNFTDVDWLKINEGQAEIHMMALAEAIWDVLNESTPKILQEGEWHIPFEDNIDKDWLYKNSPREGKENVAIGSKYAQIKIATAMCARVSYTVVGESDKVPNYENDIKLHDRLALSGHWSPFEHCAKSMTEEEYWDGNMIQEPGWSGNFKGFVQYRKTFKNENIV